MKTVFSLVWLFTGFFAENVISARIVAPRRQPQDSDEAVLAHFERSGNCFYYFTERVNKEKSIRPCKVFCREKEGSESYGCDASAFGDVDFYKLDYKEDDDGNPFVIADCVCSVPIAEELLRVVAEGLARLDDVLCVMMLEALNTVLEFGIAAIPGGAGARAAVQAAKTFAENGLEASSFGGWVGPACGVSDWNFDLFSALLQGPDSIGVSTGCHRKNKADYTGRATTARTTTTTPSDIISQTSAKSTESNGKTNSKETTSSVTSDACRLSKRVPPPETRKGKFGEDERSEECNNNVRLKYPPADCSIILNTFGSSVMDIHHKTKDMTEYFWPGDDDAPAHMVQRVRLVPFDDNRGAGQIWKGFCEDNNAISTKVRVAKTTSWIQSNFIRTQPNPKVEPQYRGKDRTATIISSVSVLTARAIFKFTDWDGLPKDNQWYGLKDNKCWPKDLAPEDPGWALLTNDEFYQAGQHPDLQVHTQSYRGLPDLAAVEQALAANNDKPPYPFTETRRFARIMRRNDTDPAQDADDHSAFNDEMAQIDDYSNEELNQWIEDYMRLMKKYYPDQYSDIVPPTTYAQQTPKGQGEPTTVPAIQGSLPTAEVPAVTKSTM
ncbi:hypothetical protein DL771_007449 [Monosporascus sp. 5C6A]|nr:hypothetical protein DL771_007449 [Monosporascus sp. 5C6A]